MGCCKSKLEIGEVVLPPFENLELQYQSGFLELSQTQFTSSKTDRINNHKDHDERLIRTEEGFSDVSLDSHEEHNYEHTLETSKTRLGDSLLYFRRPTSISLHRTDVETAFLQISGILRRNTLEFSKHENLARIRESKN
ncbi:hypothetical protein SteCoe_682 [Stentor coeruleus]|uniref:Uncharacterized protein n=1 Tax=Stentor coeruleus TaxID=5963 RepID=A0A1R2D3J0_9CILI|nr:hypothetical protein SteCoe_682 [Stentor coeruleus]